MNNSHSSRGSLLAHRVRGVLLVLAVLLGSLAWQPAAAQPTATINYQGMLLDGAGVAVTDGDYNMRFWLFQSTGQATTSAIWSESRTGASQVAVVDGLFSVMLGSTSPLTAVDFNQPLYLGIEIGGTGGSPAWDGEMLPRKPLGTVPAAFESYQLGGVASSSFVRSDQPDTIAASATTTLLTITQSGTGDILNVFDDGTEVLTVIDGGQVGIGTTTPSSRLTVAGDFHATGILRDSAGGAGTNGYLLQTTATGTQWVATSSLGIGGGGGSSLFTDGGATTYLTAVGDNLAVGTTTGTTKLDVWGGLRVGTGTPALFVDSAATRIGIGTGAPGYNIDIQTNNRPTINLSDTSINSYNSGTIRFNRTLSGGGRRVALLDFKDAAQIEAWKDVGDNAAGNLRFSTDAPGAPTQDIEHMRITSTGEVGIGTTTPSSRLTVAGDFHATGILRDSAGGAGTNGYLLQTTATGTQWVATSSLGLGGGSGATAFLGLTDTPSSFTASRIPFTNSGATALTDSADLTFGGGTLFADADVNISSTSVYQINGFTALKLQAGPFQGINPTNVYVNTNPTSASTTRAHSNVAMGYRSLTNLTTGYENVTVGAYALRDTTGGILLTALGRGALNTLADGSYSTAVGSNAGQQIRSGDRLTLLGHDAGLNLSTSSNSVIIGHEAVGAAGGGSAVNNLTVLGYQAGRLLTTGGNNNILVGHQVADSLTTGANNIIIGYDVEAPSNTGSNQLNIGNLLFGTNVDGVGTTTSSGNVGIGTSSPVSKLQVYGDVRVGTTGTNGCVERYDGGVLTGTCTSDETLKTNITPLANARATGSVLARLVQLTPVSYNWNQAANNLYAKGMDTTNIGLIAQDVQTQFPELVTRNADGFLQVDFAALPYYLLQAVRELWEVVTGNQERINSLEQRISELEALVPGAATPATPTDNNSSGTTTPDTETAGPVATSTPDAATTTASSSADAGDTTTNPAPAPDGTASGTPPVADPGDGAAVPPADSDSNPDPDPAPTPDSPESAPAPELPPTSADLAPEPTPAPVDSPAAGEEAPADPPASDPAS